MACSLPSQYLKQCWLSVFGPLGTNCCEIGIWIKVFPFKQVNELKTYRRGFQDFIVWALMPCPKLKIRVRLLLEVWLLLEVLQWVIPNLANWSMSFSSLKSHVCLSNYNSMPLQQSFSPKSSQNTTHSSPVRTKYGVCFVGLISDSCSASVTAVIYVNCHVILGCIMMAPDYLFLSGCCPSHPLPNERPTPRSHSKDGCTSR